MRTFEEIIKLAADKDDLYIKWKIAGLEARALGKECHQLVVAMDNVKIRKCELEPASKVAWVDGDKAGAKYLSILGHDYESKAKEANEIKDYWIKQVREMKQSLIR